MSERYWDLVKNARSSQRRVTVGTTTTPLVGPSPKRLALVIACGDNNAVHIHLGGETATAADLQLPVDGAPLVLSRWLHGEMVCGPISAIAIGAAEVITYWETIADRLP